VDWRKMVKLNPQRGYLYTCTEALKVALLLFILGVFLAKPGNFIVFNFPGVEEAFRLGLTPLFTMLGGILLGPLWGAGLGWFVDLIAVYLWHGIEEYMISFGLITAARGFLAGYIFYFLFPRFSLKTMVASIAIPALLISVLANPIILYFSFGAPLLRNIWLRLTLQVVAVPLFVGISFFVVRGIRESQELKKVNRALEDLLKKDELTGVATRRHFMEFLDKMYSLARRQARPLTLIMADLDGFKRINDTYGHNVGDEVLARVGSIFSEEIRNEDMVGRLGGEEFAVLLPGTRPGEAMVVAERIREKISNLQVDPMQEPITVTLGVAPLEEGASVSDFLYAADQALYKGKREGKNRVEQL